MTQKTITASFEDPDTNGLVRISLANTDGIAVGDWMHIGFDRYQVITVGQLGITALKTRKVIPPGTIALFLSE